jgi:hypothetical protein
MLQKFEIPKKGWKKRKEKKNAKLTSNSQRDEGLCVLSNLFGIDVGAVFVDDW